VRKLKQQEPGDWPNAFRVASMIPAADYLRAMQLRTKLQRDFAAAMKEFDLYITLPYVGPTVELTNLTGHPSLITRAGMLKGRPKMMEFIGHPYHEQTILQVGHAFEKAMGVQTQWPDTAGLVQ
jgi:Asp-tRNA(Asn)/Glu-tRNA(Gln) amidotransferase A subunit family amidase